MSSYRDNALRAVNRHNWNSYDKTRIKEEALKDIQKELREPHFSGVSYPRSIISPTVDRITKEIMNKKELVF